MSIKQKLNRRRTLRSVMMLSILPALLFCQVSIPEGSAQTVTGIEFVFDIVPDEPTLSSLPATGGTFYLQGKVYFFRSVNQATCEFNTSSPRQLGTWRAWGTVADNGRVVLNQSLFLDSMRGTIELQGTTGVTLGSQPAAPAIPGNITGPTTGPTEVLSVTGGTGSYRAINGEAHVRSYCSDPTRPFRYDRPFCIGIIEGKRK
ncbi:MAG TPA: hypothetical protein VLD57_10355 [Blastocatellia bacterium]|nr:hypothetical protein [Blastocatellia bacterium]